MDTAVDVQTGEVADSLPPEGVIFLLLRALNELYSKQDVNTLREQEEIAGILTPELLAQVEVIKRRWVLANRDLTEQVADLVASVKERTLEHGATVKSPWATAALSKGRTSWDTQGLDKYAEDNPKIKEFRKTGDPYVSIRRKAQRG